jgi:hypothetical protein
MLFSIRPCPRFTLAYCSGFWSLILLLVLSSGSAYAELAAIGTTEEMTVYADPDTIRRTEATVKMSVLFDFKTTRSIEGHLILSIKGEEEYDCEGTRQRIRTYSEFSGNMGGGKEVNSKAGDGTWVPVAPESVGHTLWSFACGKP